MTAFEEKPLIKTNINAGIYVMSPSILENMKECRMRDMDDSINETLERKGHIHIHALKKFWIDVGYVEDYERANNEWKVHFA